MSRTSDPIALEVFRHRLQGVATDMGEVMRRAALSPMIKERDDRSCAIFNRDLKLVAQAEHLPIHLALLVNIVPAALRHLGSPLLPGEVCLHNDPYVGGSHLPDVTAISAIYDTAGDELLGYCAVIAHHGDIGGASPGGVGHLTDDLLQEGIIIPPLKLYRDGELNAEVMALLKANVRLGTEFEADLFAQVAALRAGERAIRVLSTELGNAEFHEMCQDILDYSAELTRLALHELPSGVVEFEDVMDDDGKGHGPLPIHVKLTVEDGTVRADFAGTHPQLPAPVNASQAVTLSALFFVVRCLIDESIPTTSSCFDQISLSAPPGSIVSAAYPAPVAGGSLETAQRIVDTLFGAFAQLLPERIPAAGMGSHNTIAIGGIRRDGSRYVVSENLSGGSGARPTDDGISVRRTNLMNTPNRPVEVIERESPIIVRSVAVRPGSGGQGRYRGGLGMRKEYEFREPGTLAILSDRAVNRPWGLMGGGEAAGSAHQIVRSDGSRQSLPSKCVVDVSVGDRLVAETAGGGGYGDPTERTPGALAFDIEQGYTTN